MTKALTELAVTVLLGTAFWGLVLVGAVVLWARRTYKTDWRGVVPLLLGEPPAASANLEVNRGYEKAAVLATYLGHWLRTDQDLAALGDYRHYVFAIAAQRVAAPPATADLLALVNQQLQPAVSVQLADRAARNPRLIAKDQVNIVPHDWLQQLIDAQ